MPKTLHRYLIQVKGFHLCDFFKRVISKFTCSMCPHSSACKLVIKCASENDIPTTKMQNTYSLMNALRILSTMYADGTLYAHMCPYCTTQSTMYIF